MDLFLDPFSHPVSWFGELRPLMIQVIAEICLLILVVVILIVGFVVFLLSIFYVLMISI